jgi:TetR/AcrR family transcriptional regulator, regulator of autoinduction and epiphytic fitness
MARSDVPAKNDLDDSPIAAVAAQRTDGRVARGARAREAIAEALISILQQGVARPTAKQVAERAGVSLRLVFHHFEDTDAVLRAAVSIQVERHWTKLREISPEGDLLSRVRATVQTRGELYDAIAPVRRAASRVSESSEMIASQLETARKMLRAQLERTFSKEIEDSHKRSPESSKREILDALEVPASFETWDQLRHVTRRSHAATAGVVERLMLGVLQAPPPPASPKASKKQQK